MDELLDRINLDTAAFRSSPLSEQVVSAAEWEAAAQDLGEGAAELMALWASRRGVHMLLHAEDRLGLLTLETNAGFPSVGRHHAPAQRQERAIRDLLGYTPEGSPDPRPWLDHGQWGLSRPLGDPGPAEAAPYLFLSVDGESLHQVPVGPVHAGVIEPGHFRFTAQGETLVRLEERLGYTHKGIDALMQGATIARGTEIAARVSGDSTVAYSWAYAQAVEAALGAEVSERALCLRALGAELERLANHLGDIGAICNDAGFAMMLAHCGALRERVLRAADGAFGHRLMRGFILPGGVARDLDDRGRAAISALSQEVRARFPALVRLYDTSPSLLDRTVETGWLNPDLAARFAAGGFVGRASGRDFDTRRDLPYAPYDRFPPDVPARRDGDVNARVWIRIEEVGATLDLIDQLLATLPEGEIALAPPEPQPGRMGLGIVEGFRGEVLVWIEFGPDATLADSHLRDPSWFQWPLLEAAVQGNIIADFPLCNKSFNCSYSGHDL